MSKTFLVLSLRALSRWSCDQICSGQICVQTHPVFDPSGAFRCASCDQNRSRRFCRTRAAVRLRVLIPLSVKYEKTAQGRLFHIWRRERDCPKPSLVLALRAHSAALHATKIAPGDFVEPEPLCGLGSSSLSRSNTKKPPKGGFFIFGGERGIRTLGTLLTYTRFPGEPIQPLWHLSVSWLYFNCSDFWPLRGVRSRLLRASCPPPLRGRLLSVDVQKRSRRFCRTLGTLLTYTRFPGEPIQPLWHLSVSWTSMKGGNFR